MPKQVIDLETNELVTREPLRVVKTAAASAEFGEGVYVRMWRQGRRYYVARVHPGEESKLPNPASSRGEADRMLEDLARF